MMFTWNTRRRENHWKNFKLQIFSYEGSTQTTRFDWWTDGSIDSKLMMFTWKTRPRKTTGKCWICKIASIVRWWRPLKLHNSAEEQMVQSIRIWWWFWGREGQGKTTEKTWSCNIVSIARRPLKLNHLAEEQIVQSIRNWWWFWERQSKGKTTKNLKLQGWTKTPLKSHD